MKEQSIHASIVDAHAHLGRCANFYMPDTSLDRMICVMDKIHIRRVCCSHLAGLLAPYFDFAHRETLEAAKRYPGRIFGYAVYDPNYSTQSLASVKEYLVMHEFVGIKIHPAAHTYPIDGEKYDPLWKYASDSNTPVLSHTWDTNPLATYPYDPRQTCAEPKLIGRVAQRYPEVRIIIAHAGGHYDGHLQTIEVAQKHKNVYVDICGSTLTFGLIEWLVKEIGADRLLYGSDLNWADPRVHLGRVVGARITLAEKERILSLNAQDLFGFAL